MGRAEKRLIHAGGRGTFNLRNLNQRECKQGNINPLVCAQRFCASAKNL